MTLIESLIAQGKRAFREPRQAAADVIALGFPREALAPALFLVVVISVLLTAAADMITSNPFAMSYFRMALLITIIFLSFSFAIAKIGQMMSGVGTFPDSILLAIFFQAIFIPLQIVQIILLLFSPVLATFLAYAIVVIGFWINLNFIAALHGYQSLGRALGVLLLASVAVALCLVLITPLLGINIAGSAVGV